MARSHGSRAKSIRSFEIYDAIPVCDVPIGKQVLPGQWVITLTPQPGQANIVKFKARFVARGDRIWSSNDPEDVYSPVSDAITRKLFLAIVADENFDCRQGDFNTAFLNAPLDEPVWMKSPPAFEETDVSGRPLIWPLKKALYGLSQAPLALKKHAAAVFADLGFRPIESDPCLFVRNRGGSKLMLLLYVDDFLLAGPTVQVDKAWAELETRFKIDDPWRLAPGRYLGMDVSSDRRAAGTIRLSMATYIANRSLSSASRRFDRARHQWTRSSSSSPARRLCRTRSGPPWRPSTTGQPLLGRSQTRPAPEHWDAVTRVFGCLKAKSNLDLVFRGANGKGSPMLSMWSDAS